MLGSLRIDAVGYDHPDAARLIEEVQQEYVVRYGGRDDSPADPAEFAPPGGLFLVGYLGGVGVVMRRLAGARRRTSALAPALALGD